MTILTLNAMVRLKARMLNSIHFSHVAGRPLRTCAIFCCFPGMLSGSFIGSQTFDTQQPVLRWNAGIAGSSLTPCTSLITAPLLFK